MISLNDKVVVVTGATSGIGKATVLALSRKGARVVSSGRRLDKLLELKSLIEKEGGECLAIQTDVTKEDEVRALMRGTVDRFGAIDILINCAGRGLKSEIKDTSTDEWQSVLQTNLTGVFLCSREVIKIMLDLSIQGHIITVSSIAAIYGTPQYAAYCASKHGVTGFARSLKWEMRKYGIKGSTVHPGRVDTEFFNTYPTRPGKSGMLPASDLSDLIVAIAERSTTRRFLLFSRNLIRRSRFMLTGRA